MADDTSTTDTTTADEPQTTTVVEVTDAPADLGDAGRAALAAERKAKRDAERQLKAAQDQLKQYEDANRTETEKATAAAQAAEQAAGEWKSRYEKLVTRASIVDAAAKARAVDPEVVYSLVRDDIDLDDDGNPVGVDKAIAQLAKTKPFLFNTTPGGARDVNAGGTYALNDGDALTKALLGAVGAR